MNLLFFAERPAQQKIICDPLLYSGCDIAHYYGNANVGCLFAKRMQRADKSHIKAKIAVFYPAFLGGGAEAVALWTLEALKHTYDLTLFTVADVDFDRLNTLYGTQLSHQFVKTRTLFSQRYRSLVNAAIANNFQVRMLLFHLLIRHMQANNHAYHLLMSTYNAVDFGKKGLQYIHWINVLESSALYNKISNFSIDRMQQNVSLTNSHMVAELVKQTYGCEPTILYPPVVIDSPAIPWEQKEDAFICSGRLTQAKEPDKVIAILKQVREQGFDIKLYLTGGGGGSYAWNYQQFLKKLVRENASWITLYENLSYQDYVNVLARCKYGLHYKTEPFGISIAEMVKAGAIPFVRDRGGQVEIVGQQHPELLFANPQDAAEKIVQVLKSSTQQAQLCDSLDVQRSLFSTQRFIKEINHVVASCLEQDSLHKLAA